MKKSSKIVEKTENIYGKVPKIQVENFKTSEYACELDIEVLRNDDPVIFTEPRTKDQAVQVYFPEEFSDVKFLVCNRSKENGICEAETQTNTTLSPKVPLRSKDKIC